MSTSYKLRNPEGLYFISFGTVHWIDLFTRPTYNNILVESLRHCQENTGLETLRWCL
ncbi:hypothetical protein FUAX_17900 [Fulvitalea axinellae]|uniref:Transposase n=1 Tax=Fulvitalea axinellae TaxID=1182444 RepID=A0AAU9CH52_9BACT|nr:hypothetical protein FUAX_17900 [Fulvitalea axinellae]